MSVDDRFFVDTNVLLYSLDPIDRGKQRAAQGWLAALWEEGCGSLSWQVLHEFYVNAIRKVGVPKSKARATVEAFSLWHRMEPGLGLVGRAWHWMDVGQVTYWDGLIVAAAEQTGSAWLLSEDFQVGRKFGAVTVINPFRAEPREFGLMSR
jgi:predicted nucleic acid-binding protein